MGAPCSGKTTVAAMAFASLKGLGLPCEFIPEQARWRIARLRVERGLAPSEPVVLSDVDQMEIMKSQFYLESVFTRAVGPSVIVISDSSVLLSLLYMSAAQRRSPEVAELVRRSVAQVNLYFHALPVPAGSLFDPNRIHSHEESLAIDTSFSDVLAEHAPEVLPRMELLAGHQSTRQTRLVERVLREAVRI
jgi:hypothetical protein